MYQNPVCTCISWCSKICWFLVKKCWCQQKSRDVSHGLCVSSPEKAHLSKVWSITLESVRRVQNKEYYLCFHSLFWHFCSCFSSKNLCFSHFHFFFWWNIQFLQQNITQSETWIGDTKLSIVTFQRTSSINELLLLFDGMWKVKAGYIVLCLDVSVKF